MSERSPRASDGSGAAHPAVTDLQAVPSLDELRAKPERANDLPRDVLLRLMLDAHQVMAICAVTVASKANGSPTAESDRLLTVNQAAPLLGVKPKWIYGHEDLPFVVRISERKLRVSEEKLRRWIKSRNNTA